MIEIAKILKPQGIYGEIKVQLFSNNVDTFFEKGFAYDKQGKKIEYTGVRACGSNVIITMEGVNSRNDAELFRGVFLYLNRRRATSEVEEFPPKCRAAASGSVSCSRPSFNEGSFVPPV